MLDQWPKGLKALWPAIDSFPPLEGGSFASAAVRGTAGAPNIIDCKPSSCMLLGQSQALHWRSVLRSAQVEHGDEVMPYIAEISRSNPSCFVFLIDQSGSMVDPIAGSNGKRKCDSVADAINRLLHNLIIKCARGEGVRNFYDIAVIGYGAQVAPGFSGPLAGRELVPISEIANSPARVEEREKSTSDGAGGTVVKKAKFPVWFEPVAQGTTPMGGALTAALRMLEGWVAQHAQSFPPIVINITDGEATDSGPVPQAEALRNLCTSDGNALLFNCHISKEPVSPVVFPDSDASLPDSFARTLYQISSPLPESIRNLAHSERFDLGPEARGFAFNADLVELIRFLDIGTRASNLR